MHVTCWTYPWDIVRLGAPEVLGDLAEQGFAGIDLAATYHPISVLSPRGPHVRGFFAPSGGVFFPARAERYGRIRPAVWPDRDVVAGWEQAAGCLDRFGMELNAWTIGLFQPWMAQQYPHVARVYATGDRLDAGVCPSNADVREYLAALAADLCDQFPVQLVKLEGVRNPAFDYGWIRRRIYFTLTETQKCLLGLCFCDGCVTAARDRGIDVEAVRARVLADTGSDDAELRAYGTIADESAAALVAAVAAAVRSVSTTAAVAVASPNEAGGPGAPVGDVIDNVGAVLLLSVGERAEAVERTAAQVLAHPDGLGLEYMLHPPTTSPLGALPSGINEALDDEEWLADLSRARELGVNRISVYNYGLLTDATFRRLAALAL